MDRTSCVSVCPYCNRETKQISSYKLQTNGLFSRYDVQHHIDIGTGDLLVGLSVRGVRENTHFSVVPRIRESGALTALAFRGRPLSYISCQNCVSGNVSRPEIDIRIGVQFVMDRNTKGRSNR